MTDTKRELRGELIYRTHLFDQASITRFLGGFQAMLEAALLRPNATLPQQSQPLIAEISPLATEARRTDGNSTDAPPDGLERSLAGIWETVLNRRPIGVTDNFFSLGGHSLSALLLFQQIERRYRRQLPLSLLFQAPTIRQMAQVLREDGVEPNWRCLVPIQAGGPHPPIFFLHGRDGNVLNFYDLSRHLGKEQPVFGLQSWGMDGHCTPYSTIEEMAAHYVEEICGCFPEGPYLLGGMSMGGLIAYEAAQQLQAAGKDVALLVMFDTWLEPDAMGGRAEVAGFEILRRRFLFNCRRVRQHAARLVRLPLRDLRGYLTAKFKTIRRRIKSRTWQVAYQTWANSGKPLPPALQKVSEYNGMAAARYRPKPYRGVITYFQARDQEIQGPFDSVANWRVLARDVQVHRVPGTHLSLMYPPHVEHVGRKLNAVMQDFWERGLAPATSPDPEE